MAKKYIGYCSMVDQCILNSGADEGDFSYPGFGGTVIPKEVKTVCRVVG